MMRHTSHKRWPIVKHIRIIFRSICNRPFEYLVFFPVLDKVFFVLDSRPAAPLFEFHRFSFKEKSPLLEMPEPYCQGGTIRFPKEMTLLALDIWSYGPGRQVLVLLG